MLSWSPELRRALRSRPSDDEMLPSDYVKRTKPSTYDTPGRSLETRLFIRNEFVHSVSGRIFTSVSLGNVQESTCEDVDKAVSFRYTFKWASISVHLSIFWLPFFLFDAFTQTRSLPPKMLWSFHLSGAVVNRPCTDTSCSSNSQNSLSMTKNI
jgi:hypothetical protein